MIVETESNDDNGVYFYPPTVTVGPIMGDSGTALLAVYCNLWPIVPKITLVESDAYAAYK